MGCGGAASPVVGIVGAAAGQGFTAPNAIEVSWTAVDVPGYNSPGIGSLTIGGDPPSVPGIPFNMPNSPFVAGGGNISPLNTGTVPTFAGGDPGFGLPPQPGAFTEIAPSGTPGIDDVTVPDPPDIEPLPDLPTVADADLPDLLPLDIPVFAQEFPDATGIVIPSNTFDFVEADYTSDVIDKTTTELMRMLDGELIIPDEVWTQIFEQGADREEVSGAKLITEATDDWAARGWAAPSGVLDKRIREARQSVQNSRNTLARDTTIKRAEHEIESIKYAIAQGVAFETMLIGLHNSIQDRALKAAELSVTIAIQLMNAQIAIYNAELQAYQTAANVFKSLLDAEIVKVEIYKAEIQAASLVIDVDKAKIEAYKAQIEGLNLLVELHNNQIAGINAQVALDKLRVDAFKSQVDVYVAQVGAWSTEWDGYKAATQAETAKAQVFSARAQAYAAEVGGYEAGVRAAAVKVEADAKTIEIDIARMSADATRFAAAVSGQAARAKSIADTYNAQMAGYSASAAFGAAQARAFEAELNASVADAKAAATAGIEGARIAASQADAQSRAIVSAAETTAKIEAQLAASQLGQFSAIASHSASSTDSFSYSC